MPGVDWIPFISQIKALGQLIIDGNVDGFNETTSNFLRECPVFSQITSIIQLINNEPEAALETQRRCLKTVSNVADATPIIGHIKGICHDLMGDKEGRDQAYKASNRSSLVMLGGFIGGLLSGGILAVPAGIATGFIFDLKDSAESGDDRGLIALLNKTIENPNAANVIDAVVSIFGDGFLGYAGYDIVNQLMLEAQVKTPKYLEQLREKQFGSTEQLSKNTTRKIPIDVINIKTCVKLGIAARALPKLISVLDLNSEKQFVETIYEGLNIRFPESQPKLIGKSFETNFNHFCMQKQYYKALNETTLIHLKQYSLGMINVINRFASSEIIPNSQINIIFNNGFINGWKILPNLPKIPAIAFFTKQNFQQIIPRFDCGVTLLDGHFYDATFLSQFPEWVYTPRAPYIDYEFFQKNNKSIRKKLHNLNIAMLKYVSENQRLYTVGRKGRNTHSKLFWKAFILFKKSFTIFIICLLLCASACFKENFSISTTNNVLCGASSGGNGADPPYFGKRTCNYESESESESDSEDGEDESKTPAEREAIKALKRANLFRKKLCLSINGCIHTWKKLTSRLAQFLSHEECEEISKMLEYLLKKLISINYELDSRNESFLDTYRKCVTDIQRLYERSFELVQRVIFPLLTSPNSVTRIENERFEQLINLISTIPTTEFTDLLQRYNYILTPTNNVDTIRFYQNIAIFVGELEGRVFPRETLTPPSSGRNNATFAVFSIPQIPNTLFVSYNYYSEVIHNEEQGITGHLSSQHQREIVQNILNEFGDELRQTGIQRIRFERHHHNIYNQQIVDIRRERYRDAHRGHAEIVAIAIANFYGAPLSSLIMGVNKDLCIYCANYLMSQNVPIYIGPNMHICVKRWVHPNEIEFSSENDEEEENESAWIISI